jgi:integrating conjugative element protein (TIGR03765 family)
MLEPTLRRQIILVLVCVDLFSSSAHSQNSITSFALPTVDVEDFLPVRTLTMKVGPFEAQRRRTGVSRPFFLIGCDAYSLTWLVGNRERLAKLGAFGLVIEAEDATAYRRLEAAAEGLVVRPVAGDVIAEHLRIEYYPALVTADGIAP